MMCHCCYQLNGLKVNTRGQAVPCHCPAGNHWREQERLDKIADERLGLTGSGQSIVQPWQENGRTVLI